MLTRTATTIEERLAIVNKILEENPNPSEYYLEKMADYLIEPLDKEEKKEQKRKIITDNRKETLRKHEVSYEGLASSLESGEDGIYHLIGDPLRRTKLDTKKPITPEDIARHKPLQDVREAIEFWEEEKKNAVGHRAYKIHTFIKEFRKYQYVLRDMLEPPITFHNVTPIKYMSRIHETFSIDKNGNIHWSGTSFCDPKICSTVLCNYSNFQEQGWDDLEGDMHFFMLSFDKYCAQALEGEPLLEQVVIDKIDGFQNAEIQEHIKKEFGLELSTEYISSLWRNKIPKMIAAVAEDDYIQDWYLNVEKGTYKKCSKCGEIKIAHPKYFSRNSTSNDGYYSICKNCRNKFGQKS